MTETLPQWRRIPLPPHAQEDVKAVRKDDDVCAVGDVFQPLDDRLQLGIMRTTFVLMKPLTPMSVVANPSPTAPLLVEEKGAVGVEFHWLLRKSNPLLHCFPTPGDPLVQERLNGDPVREDALVIGDRKVHDRMLRRVAGQDGVSGCRS